MYDWYNTNSWKLDERETYFFNELSDDIKDLLTLECLENGDSIDGLEANLYDEEGNIIGGLLPY